MKAFLAATFAILGIQTVQGQSFPEIITFFAPSFPHAAMAVRAQGDVQVRVEVNSDGNVISASALSGHKLLQKAAETAATKWTFTAKKGNHYLVLRFLFRLQDYGDKKMAKLVGDYTLWVSYPLSRILQTTSYESSPAE